MDDITLNPQVFHRGVIILKNQYMCFVDVKFVDVVDESLLFHNVMKGIGSLVEGDITSVDEIICCSALDCKSTLTHCF